jgi:hypothetical protein
MVPNTHQNMISGSATCTVMLSNQQKQDTLLWITNGVFHSLNPNNLVYHCIAAGHVRSFIYMPGSYGTAVLRDFDSLKISRPDFSQSFMFSKYFVYCCFHS